MSSEVSAVLWWMTLLKNPGVDAGKRRIGVRSEAMAHATVGDRIRTQRVELGLSQRQLACDGVSYAYISRIESNQRRPSIRALRKIAPTLGVSVHWLETGELDPSQQLAQLVLAHKGRPLPPRASTLARRLLHTVAEPG